MRTIGIWVLAAGLSACSVSEDNYAEVQSKAVCAKLQRCEKGSFEDEWRDKEDCVDEVTEDVEDAQDVYDDLDCEYDPAEAGRCVRRIRRMSCEEFAEGATGSACDLVFDCGESR